MEVNPKAIKTKRITASGLVTDNPCLIYVLCGVGVSGVNNRFTVYNGFGSANEHKLTLEAGQYSSDNRQYIVPLFFSKGLYVTFTTGGDEFFAQFYELNRPL